MSSTKINEIKSIIAQALFEQEAYRRKGEQHENGGMPEMADSFATASTHKAQEEIVQLTRRYPLDYIAEAFRELGAQATVDFLAPANGHGNFAREQEQALDRMNLAVAMAAFPNADESEIVSKCRDQMTQGLQKHPFTHFKNAFEEWFVPALQRGQEIPNDLDALDYLWMADHGDLNLVFTVIPPEQSESYSDESLQQTGVAVDLLNSVLSDLETLGDNPSVTVELEMALSAKILLAAKFLPYTKYYDPPSYCPESRKTIIEKITKNRESAIEIGKQRQDMLHQFVSPAFQELSEEEQNQRGAQLIPGIKDEVNRYGAASGALGTVFDRFEALPETVRNMPAVQNPFETFERTKAFIGWQKIKPYVHAPEPRRVAQPLAIARPEA